MVQALQLAARGEGYVEPNPMVGCLIAREEEVLATGWHRQFGGPHAEVAAIDAAEKAGEELRGATLYVTLEPCCHHGKTPPCTEAIINSGIRRVVIARRDPFPQVDGGGIAQLEAAGLEVLTGCLAAEAQDLNAPYLMRVSNNRPWIIAKWAMTLDGKLATVTGDSRWISSAASREVVHRLRARMDAILVGRETAVADDPLLTARPQDDMIARTATRIVLDSSARLPLNSQLVRSARQTPVLVAVAESAPRKSCSSLQASGCEVFYCLGASRGERVAYLMQELARRGMTNVLVEGGSQVFGCLLDAQLMDEVHVFIAPKLVGGDEAPSPLAGFGKSHMSAAVELSTKVIAAGPDEDVYVVGRRR